MKFLSSSNIVAQMRHFFYDAFLQIRQAFIVLLPVIVTINIIIILGQLIQWVNPSLGVLKDKLSLLSSGLMHALPFMVLIALTELLAQRRGVDRISAILIGLSSFLIFKAFFTKPNMRLIDDVNLFQMIALSFITVYLLERVQKNKKLHLVSNNALLSQSMVTAFNLLIPSLIVMFTILIIASILHFILLYISHYIQFDVQLNMVQNLVFYTLCDIGVWFFGLNGSNVTQSFLQSLSQGNSSIYSGSWLGLSNVFVSIGGTGSTLGLLFAIMLTSKVKFYRSICKVALPFSIFNINEILIYGLPIALNLRLLIPFMLAPLANLLITLVALHFSVFEIVNPHISWVTPPIISAYLLSNGNMAAVVLQVICILIDILIYIPFVVKQNHLQDDSVRLKTILQGQHHKMVSNLVTYQSENHFVQVQEEVLDSFRKAEDIVKTLDGGQFTIFIQPKVNISTGQIYGGEVLLRMICKDGSITGPYFLESLYHLGLSADVDDRVIDMTFDFLQIQQRMGLQIPSIAINLDKPFLLDETRMARFIYRCHRYHNIYVEITEHTYIDVIEKLPDLMTTLQKANIKLSIDDFGAGYSSLALLSVIDADEIKFDRSLISQLNTPKGRLIVQHAKALCDSLQCNVVAEGVESQRQLDILKEIGIINVQGYMTGAPMPARDFIVLYNTQQALLKAKHQHST